MISLDVLARGRANDGPRWNASRNQPAASWACRPKRAQDFRRRRSSAAGGRLYLRSGPKSERVPVRSGEPVPLLSHKNR